MVFRWSKNGDSILLKMVELFGVVAKEDVDESYWCFSSFGNLNLNDGLREVPGVLGVVIGGGTCGLRMNF